MTDPMALRPDIRSTTGSRAYEMFYVPLVLLTFVFLLMSEHGGCVMIGYACIVSQTEHQDSTQQSIVQNVLSDGVQWNRVICDFPGLLASQPYLFASI